MRFYPSLFIVLLFVCASVQPLTAAPQILAEIHLKISELSNLGKESPTKAPTPTPANTPPSSCSAFLLQMDDGTLQPVVAIQGLSTAQLPSLLRTLRYSPVGSWQLGTWGSLPGLSADFIRSVLIPAASAQRSAPVFAQMRAKDLVAALKADKTWGSLISTSVSGAVLTEASSLQLVELRATPMGSGLRAILRLQATPGSALHTFFSQRLPTQLPNEHFLIPVSGASGYGYAVYHPNAVVTYMRHLAQITRAAMPLSSQQIEALATHWECAEGYSAFVMMPGEAAPRVFHKGSWNRGNAPEAIRTGIILSDPLADPKAVQVDQAFTLGTAPVWRLQQTTKGNATARTLYFSVSQGNITQASTPEALSSWVADLIPPGTDNNNFSRNFGHLPTLSFQFKMTADSLLKKWKQPATSPGWVYAAGSLASGQMALTIDAPASVAARLRTLLAP